MTPQVTEYQQVAGLLNNRIELIAEYFHTLDDAGKQEAFDELNEYRAKVTTDSEFRDNQWKTMFALFNIGRV